MSDATPEGTELLVGTLRIRNVSGCKVFLCCNVDEDDTFRIALSDTDDFPPPFESQALDDGGRVMFPASDVARAFHDGGFRCEIVCLADDESDPPFKVEGFNHDAELQALVLWILPSKGEVLL